jgi:hypothetical protein
MKPSERTKAWMRAYPEKAQLLVIRSQQKRKERQQEALKDLEHSKFKTPMDAIRAFCRRCTLGDSRGGGVFPKAHVYCRQIDCPLYAFRNSNPNRVKAGMRDNNIRKHRKPSV